MESNTTYTSRARIDMAEEVAGRINAAVSRYAGYTPREVRQSVYRVALQEVAGHTVIAGAVDRARVDAAVHALATSDPAEESTDAEHSGDRVTRAEADTWYSVEAYAEDPEDKASRDNAACMLQHLARLARMYRIRAEVAEAERDTYRAALQTIKGAVNDEMEQAQADYLDASGPAEEVGAMQRIRSIDYIGKQARARLDIDWLRLDY